MFDRKVSCCPPGSQPGTVLLGGWLGSVHVSPLRGSLISMRQLLFEPVSYAIKSVGVIVCGSAATKGVSVIFGTNNVAVGVILLTVGEGVIGATSIGRVCA